MIKNVTLEITWVRVTFHSRFLNFHWNISRKVQLRIRGSSCFASITLIGMCLLILNGSSCKFNYCDNKSDSVVTFIVSSLSDPVVILGSSTKWRSHDKWRANFFNVGTPWGVYLFDHVLGPIFQYSESFVRLQDMSAKRACVSWFLFVGLSPFLGVWQILGCITILHVGAYLTFYERELFGPLGEYFGTFVSTFLAVWPRSMTR